MRGHAQIEDSEDIDGIELLIRRPYKRSERYVTSLAHWPTSISSAAPRTAKLDTQADTDETKLPAYCRLG